MFILFFIALNFKLTALKLRENIISLEEKNKYLSIKLENKKRKFQKLLSPSAIKSLAKKHNVILKDMENIEILKYQEKKILPVAKNARKKP